jgi:hypothetical protein
MPIIRGRAGRRSGVLMVLHPIDRCVLHLPSGATIFPAINGARTCGI